MPRVTTTQQNFTAGEVSPRLYGRSDLARYMAGAKEITNGIVLQHGGIRRRDGTLYVADAGGSTVRLIRYVFNRDQAYCLEFGVGYIRFFTDSGAVVNNDNTVYQITSTYTADELFELEYAQTGNVMFIAHRNHPLAQLERLAHNSWTLTDVSYVNQPVKDDVWKPKHDLILSDITVGTNRWAESPVFRSADYLIDATGNNVSRKIYSVGGGEAIVTGSYDQANHGIRHYIEILKPFESTTIDPLNWWMDGSPQVPLTITGILAAGSAMELSYGTSSESLAWGISTAVATTYYGRPAVTLGIGVMSGATIRVGDVLRITKTDGNVRCYTVYYSNASGTPANVICKVQINEGEDVAGFLGASNCKIRYLSGYASGNVATAEDVGSIISINGGYVKVTEVWAHKYVGTVVKTLNSGVTAGAGSWNIQRPAWTADSGYPAAVSSWEQRLVVSGTAFSPNTVWFSKIGNYYDFLPGSLDDDALSVTISGDEQADIVHLMQGKALVALASNGEYTFVGGVEKPITPTNIQIKNQSVFGCSKVRPQRIGNELYFVQRAGRKIRAFTYKYDSDDYGAPDLSIMSEHLTESGIKDMAYCAEPESILWMVRNDGDLVAVTLERENDVIAFTHCETDGTIESVCSIPSSSGDTLWMCVNRNGARRIEKMATSVYMDSAINGTGPATTWSGLDHLEGKTVSYVADGVYIGDYVVSGGSITTTRSGTSVTIGLNYTTTIETLMQDFGTGTGSVHGNSNRIGEVTLRFMDTIGCKINGDEVAFRRLDTSILDDAPSQYSGLHRLELLGWERGDVSVTIVQDKPLPLHIQQVIYKFQSND